MLELLINKLATDIALEDADWRSLRLLGKVYR